MVLKNIEFYANSRVVNRPRGLPSCCRLTESYQRSFVSLLTATTPSSSSQKHRGFLLNKITLGEYILNNRPAITNGRFIFSRSTVRQFWPWTLTTTSKSQQWSLAQTLNICAKFNENRTCSFENSQRANEPTNQPTNPGDHNTGWQT